MNAEDLCAPVNVLSLIPNSRVSYVCRCELLMARTAGKKSENKSVQMVESRSNWLDKHHKCMRQSNVINSVRATNCNSVGCRLNDTLAYGFYAHTF